MNNLQQMQDINFRLSEQQENMNHYSFLPMFAGIAPSLLEICWTKTNRIE